MTLQLLSSIKNILYRNICTFVEAAEGQRLVGDEKADAKELVQRIGEMITSLDRRAWEEDYNSDL
jgi:hypothetical protein